MKNLLNYLQMYKYYFNCLCERRRAVYTDETYSDIDLPSDKEIV